MTDKPKPGSAEAVDLGRECAIIDNHYGKGIILNGERVWWINADCPLHGDAELAALLDREGHTIYEDTLPHSEDDA